MTIDILYLAGCPSYRPTAERIQNLLREENVAGQIRCIEISDLEHPDRRFLGSPTILVNGVDIEPCARTDVRFGMCCRIYEGEGIPSIDLVRRALRGAPPAPTEGQLRD